MTDALVSFDEIRKLIDKLRQDIVIGCAPDDEATVQAAVDQIDLPDYGTVEVVVNRWLPRGTVYVVDLGELKVPPYEFDYRPPTAPGRSAIVDITVA